MMLKDFWWFQFYKSFLLTQMKDKFLGHWLNIGYLKDTEIMIGDLPVLETSSNHTISLLHLCKSSMYSIEKKVYSQRQFCSLLYIDSNRKVSFTKRLLTKEIALAWTQWSKKCTFLMCEPTNQIWFDPLGPQRKLSGWTPKRPN